MNTKTCEDCWYFHSTAEGFIGHCTHKNGDNDYECYPETECNVPEEMYVEKE